MPFLSHTGAGPSLVLVHGRASNQETWECVLPGLGDYRVHRADLLGHGDSPAPKDPSGYSIPAQAEALARGLKTVPELSRPFVLVGHSMGGFVSLRYALDHPERLRGLVLMATSAINPFRNGRHKDLADSVRDKIRIVEEEGMEALADWMEAHEELHPRQRRNLMKITPEGYVQSILACRDMPSMVEALGRIRIPTLVVCGYKDTVFMPECQLLAEKIPGAQTLYLKEAGHSPHREATEGFLQGLHGFLENLAP